MSIQDIYINFHDPFWVITLSLVLFFPVRQMIWVLYVRKLQKTQNEVSDEEKKKIKKTSFFYFCFTLYSF